MFLWLTRECNVITHPLRPQLVLLCWAPGHAKTSVNYPLHIVNVFWDRLLQNNKKSMSVHNRSVLWCIWHPAIWMCKRNHGSSNQATFYHCPLERFWTLDRGQHGHSVQSVVTLPHMQQAAMHCVSWNISIIASILCYSSSGVGSDLLVYFSVYNITIADELMP